MFFLAFIGVAEDTRSQFTNPYSTWTLPSVNVPSKSFISSSSSANGLARSEELMSFPKNGGFFPATREPRGLEFVDCRTPSKYALMWGHDRRYWYSSRRKSRPGSVRELPPKGCDGARNGPGGEGVFFGQSWCQLVRVGIKTGLSRRRPPAQVLPPHGRTLPVEISRKPAWTTPFAASVASRRRGVGLCANRF